MYLYYFDYVCEFHGINILINKIFYKQNGLILPFEKKHTSL